MTVEGLDSFWAPSVIELDGKFYMYNSIEIYDDEPDKEVTAAQCMCLRLTIRSVRLQTQNSFYIRFRLIRMLLKTNRLYIFYSANRFEGEKSAHVFMLTS